MRKKLSIGFVVVLALSLLIALLGPSSASAAKVPAQVTTVQTFLNALNPLNVANAKATWAAGQQDMVATKLGQVISGTTITITKPALALKGDVVTATYGINVTKGSFYRANKKATATFTVGSGNLISASTFNFDYLVTKVKIAFIEPKSAGYASSNILVDDTVAGLKEYVKGWSLSGVPVEFVPYDNFDAGAGTATSAKAVECYKQAFLDGCAGMFGGESASTMLALFNAATGKLTVGKTNVTMMFSTSQTQPSKLPAYGVRGGNNGLILHTNQAKFVSQLNPAPQKIALLCHDEAAAKNQVLEFKTALLKLTAKMKPAPTIVYEKYVPAPKTPGESQDFTPYLKEIKASGADVLYCQTVGTYNIKDIYLQIDKLGGWGNIRFMDSVGLGWFAMGASGPLPGAIGTYSETIYTAGSAPEMEAAFKVAKLAGKLTMVPKSYPDPYNMIIVYWFYIPGAMNIIKSVEMAKTDDPVLVNKAAHSGTLQWAGPYETYKVDKTGESNAWGRIGQFTKAVPYCQLIPVK